MRHVALCSALLAFSFHAFAQVAGTGSIQGTVTDPSGAVVVDATVTATNSATGVATSRKTTDAGFYVLPLLPAGEYSVKVAAAGFQVLTQEHIILDALQTLGLSLQLQLGAANETVTVSSAPSVLKTDDVA